MEPEGVGMSTEQTTDPLFPADPQRNGPHWLRDVDGNEFVAHWIAKDQMWLSCEIGDTYVEPVLTPAEVAELRRSADAADQQTTIGSEVADLEGWFRSAAPCGDEPCRVRDARSCACVSSADTIASLRRFVQFVADYSNDPAIVREAKRHGAE
jgi:hypothetical protein